MAEKQKDPSVELILDTWEFGEMPPAIINPDALKWWAAENVLVARREQMQELNVWVSDRRDKKGPTLVACGEDYVRDDGVEDVLHKEFDLREIILYWARPGYGWKLHPNQADDLRKRLLEWEDFDSLVREAFRLELEKPVLCHGDSHE